MKKSFILLVFAALIFSSSDLSAQSQVLDAGSKNYADSTSKRQPNNASQHPDSTIYENRKAEDKATMKSSPRDTTGKGKAAVKTTRSQPNSPVDTLRVDKTNRGKMIKDSVK